MKLVQAYKIIEDLDKNKQYTHDEICSMLNNPKYGFNIDKVIHRIRHMYGLISQEHIETIINMIKDGGTGESLFD